MRQKTLLWLIRLGNYIFWAVFLLNAVSYSLFAYELNVIAIALFGANSYSYFKAARRFEGVLFGGIAAALAVLVIMGTPLSFHAG